MVGGIMVIVSVHKMDTLLYIRYIYIDSTQNNVQLSRIVNKIREVLC